MANGKRDLYTHTCRCGWFVWRRAFCLLHFLFHRHHSAHDALKGSYMKTVRYLVPSALVGALTTGSAWAAAVPIDTTEVVAQFAELNTAQAAVGALILIAAGIALTFRWVKGMFF